MLNGQSHEQKKDWKENTCKQRMLSAHMEQECSRHTATTRNLRTLTHLTPQCQKLSWSQERTLQFRGGGMRGRGGKAARPQILNKRLKSYRTGVLDVGRFCPGTLSIQAITIGIGAAHPRTSGIMAGRFVSRFLGTMFVLKLSAGGLISLPRPSIFAAARLRVSATIPQPCDH